MSCSSISVTRRSCFPVALPRRELRNKLIDGGAYEAGVSALTEPDLAGDLGKDEPHPARLLAVAL